MFERRNQWVNLPQRDVLPALSAENATLAILNDVARADLDTPALDQ